MKVLRTVKLKGKSFEIGDKINVNIKGFGKFMATAQQITDYGTLFFTDDCVATKQMNKIDNKTGGYENSDLRKWLNTVLIHQFPEKLKERMVAFKNDDLLSIPTYEQIFGSNTTRLPLMHSMKNRTCDYKGEWCFYWLQNRMYPDVYRDCFAVVSDKDYMDNVSPSNYCGIRLAFLLQAEKTKTSN